MKTWLAARRRWLPWVAALAAGCSVGGWGMRLEAEESSYVAEVEKWRQEREEKLKSDEGWLTVAGLYWLREGDNSFGTDPLSDFVLPADSAPPRVGVFEYHDRKVTVRIEPGVEVLQHGKPIREAEMRIGTEDAISIGELTLWVHYSGERLAIRLRDKNSSLRKEFTGLVWFPVDPRFRIVGRFVPYDQPRTVEMLNILGDIETFTSPGYVVFSFEGKEYRLVPTSPGDDRLWFVFRDLTSGKETYPAARFLWSKLEPDGTVVLDFNKAYNPPCAFNPHTTCPLPIKENRLPIRIEAGEKNYHKPSTS